MRWIFGVHTCTLSREERRLGKVLFLKSEETLRLAAEAAGVGTWHLSILEDALQSSSKCKEIFGLSPGAEFQYGHFLALVHPEDRLSVEGAVARALDPAGLGLYEVDYRITHPDGSQNSASAPWVNSSNVRGGVERTHQLTLRLELRSASDRARSSSPSQLVLPSSQFGRRIGHSIGRK